MLKGRVRVFLREWLLRGMRGKKMGSRLMSGFLLIALLPTIALCSIAYVGTRKQILAGEERSSMRMAQYLCSELSSLLQSYPAKLNTVASDMAVIRMLRSYRKADAMEAQCLRYELMGRLTSEALGMRGFMGMEIVNETGETIACLPYSIVTDEVFRRIVGQDEKFAFWLGQYRWGDLYPAASPGKRDKMVAIAARRIIDYANAKCIGHIVIGFDCAELEETLINTIEMQAFISDEHGDILAMKAEETETCAAIARSVNQSASVDDLRTSILKYRGERYLVIDKGLGSSPFQLVLFISYEIVLGALHRMFSAIIGAAACIVLIMQGIAVWITRSVTVPIENLSMTMRRFGSGDFDARVGDDSRDEIGLLCCEFDDMANHVQELTSQLCQAQAKEKEAVYAALQAQINPHFLYNTLDMISWMGYEASNSDICRVVNSLSDFFRLSLNHGEESFTLKDEIDHVNSYITIQQYRMCNISFRVDMPGELGMIPVPKLIVQPLVENAIQHGLKPRNYHGNISVNSYQQEKSLIICVRDDGVGFDEAQIEQRMENNGGYGIRNIRQRFTLLYGELGSLTLRNCPEGGTEAMIRIPLPD